MKHFLVERGEESHGGLLQVDVAQVVEGVDLPEVFAEEKCVPFVQDAVGSSENIMELISRSNDQFMQKVWNQKVQGVS